MKVDFGIKKYKNPSGPSRDWHPEWVDPIYIYCIYYNIYIYSEKLHTVVSTHLLYVGSNCCKAQGLDGSVEDRLSLNTAPQFGTLVVPHCLYKKDCC